MRLGYFTNHSKDFYAGILADNRRPSLDFKELGLTDNYNFCVR